jgi:hypothetical protein
MGWVRHIARSAREGVRRESRILSEHYRVEHLAHDRTFAREALTVMIELSPPKKDIAMLEITESRSRYLVGRNNVTFWRSFWEPERRCTMLSKAKYAGLCVLGTETFYLLCLIYGSLLVGKAQEVHHSLFELFPFSHGAIR